MITGVPNSSPLPESEIGSSSKKRHDQPPEEDALYDPNRSINRSQAFKFRFQVVLAFSALPRIRFSFRPAAWAFQSLIHGEPYIACHLAESSWRKQSCVADLAGYGLVEFDLYLARFLDI